MKNIKNILIGIALISLSFTVLTPLASAEFIKTPEGVIITHYPSKFDGVGIIYSIEKRGIVVDDMFIPFSSQVRYMTPQRRYSSLENFEPGQKVGYVLNEKNKITKLCLLLNM